MRNIAALLIVTLLLGACTSIELAPRAQDEDAKRFDSIPDKSVVYVIQTGGYGSSRVLVQATLNGRHVATLSGDTYARLVIDPGVYRLALSTPENQEAISFETAPGDVLYLSAGSKIGWTQMRVTPIQRLSSIDGQKAVLKRSMAYSMTP